MDCIRIHTLSIKPWQSNHYFRLSFFPASNVVFNAICTNLILVTINGILLKGDENDRDETVGSYTIVVFVSPKLGGRCDALLIGSRKESMLELHHGNKSR
jgi:hypothetical protein